MGKKNKPTLTYAFNGDAAGLRDALVHHFDQKADDTVLLEGKTYQAGYSAGERLAYRQLVVFLRRLVINAKPGEYEEVA
jgi:hypothetical protein